MISSFIKKEYLNFPLINENIIDNDYYRDTFVMITGSKYLPPAPNKIPMLINELVDKYNRILKDGFSMRDLARFHIEFEKIHPFPDGNGRTGRLLINYFLLKNNRCPLVISSGNRNKYIDSLSNNNIDELTNLLIKAEKLEFIRINQLFKKRI